MQDGILSAARLRFHAELLNGSLTTDSNGIPSVADKGSRISVSIARQWLSYLGAAVEREKASGQSAGKEFEQSVATFLEATFIPMASMRPGSWQILSGSNRAAVTISNFSQYEHLLRLAERARNDADLRAVLGGDYLIQPDVVVIRNPENETFFDQTPGLLSGEMARLTPLRAINHAHPRALLHASISCKWTLRSDRAQNARTEALNLIRNRNGRVPHIVAITAEPMPKRIASIAQGSSDLDCVYHVGLPELERAVQESLEGRRSEQTEDLEYLIRAKRLRDISDLPMDLIT